MWRPARSMVARAYGRAFTEEEISDVYSAAWTATLSALRSRGDGMTDEELRAYLLTAVASHASKEMRRRTRKPVGSLDEAQEQVVARAEQLSPEEQAIGNESGVIARDLLSSLPPRRRAVMLLRYGWGLRPEEICTLVAGLSPRAYRKEITRGVAELIERLELVESGEWCKSREPLLRDYVAGTATEDERRQVIEHLRHCRGCKALTARLRSHLHELGAAGAFLASTAAGHGHAQMADRLLAGWHGIRGAFADKVDQAAAVVGNVATSGGIRGSGAIGAGVAAKLAGLGGAGKAGLACLGVTAAAGACVATGVVPDIPIRGVFPEVRREDPAPRKERVSADRVVVADPVLAAAADEPVVDPPPAPPKDPSDEPPQTEVPHDVPASTPPTTPVAASPAQAEFDPVASAPTPAPAPSSAGSSSSSTGSAQSGGSIAAEEFGP